MEADHRKSEKPPTGNPSQHARLEQTDATAVNTLNGRMETLAAPEYMRLRAAADEARIDSEVTRLELEQHKRVHSRAH